MLIPPRPTSANWPERELAGPPGEHRERERDERHQDDPCVQEVPRRGRDEVRQRQRGEQREAARDVRVVPDPPDVLQGRRDGTDARREGEPLADPQASVPHGQHQHRDEHDDEQHAVDQARVGGVVVEDERLEDAEADAGGQRDRQRSHGGDDGRRQGPDQEARTELGRARRRWPPPAARSRIVATAASAPASAHTIVEVRFTLMADSRAASELSAAARTAMPVRVRLRNQPSPATRAGNTTSRDHVVGPHDDVVEHDPLLREGVGKAA